MAEKGSSKMKVIVLVVLATLLAGLVATYAVNPDLMQGLMRRRAVPSRSFDRSPAKGDEKGEEEEGDDKGDEKGEWPYGKGIYSGYVDCDLIPDDMLPDLHIDKVYLKSTDIPGFDFENEEYGVKNRYKVNMVVRNYGGDMTEGVHLSFAKISNISTGFGGPDLDLGEPEMHGFIRTGPLNNTLACGETQTFGMGYATLKEFEYFSSHLAVDAYNDVMEENEDDNTGYYWGRNRAKMYFYTSKRLKFYLPEYATDNSVDPDTTYIVRMYSPTLDAAVLDKVFGPQLYTNGITYYVSDDYPDMLSLAGVPLPTDSAWDTAGGSFNYYTHPLYKLEVNGFTNNQSNGLLLVGEERRAGSSQVLNYTNMIYFPPSSELEE